MLRTLCLKSLYLIAPIQNAVVESVFSHQNLIITSRRFRILIKTVGRKVLVKYCANLFSEDQLDAIVERAAVTWLELKERRVGQGSLIKLVFGLYIKSTTYEMF